MTVQKGSIFHLNQYGVVAANSVVVIRLNEVYRVDSGLWTLNISMLLHPNVYRAGEHNVTNISPEALF